MMNNLMLFDGTLHNILVQSKIPAIVLSVLLLRLWFLVVVLQQFINENDYVSSKQASYNHRHKSL